MIGDEAMSDESELIQQTNPARPRWQIHLSTAVLLSISAGIILFLNFMVGSSTPVETSGRLGRIVNGVVEGGFINGVVHGAGFPWMFTRHFDDGSFQFEPFHVALDLLFMIGTLVLIGVKAESQIRTKESKP